MGDGHPGCHLPGMGALFRTNSYLSRGFYTIGRWCYTVLSYTIQKE
uniref:Uncharacterized protein n=1 Tax=Arundo donax TaxID=35708 RepID=A0A0A9GIU9_ARUDO